MNDTRTVHHNPWFSVTLREEAGQTWYRVDRADSAMIVGTTTDGDLLLIRGRRDTTGDHALLEFPCGAIEAGETPEDAAIRETLEETGYAAVRLRPLGEAVESPGIGAATCHVFQAEVAPSTVAALEPGEEWEVELLSRAGLAAAISRHEMRDAGSLAAVAFLLAGDD